MAEERIVRVSAERDPDYGLNDESDAEIKAAERARKKKGKPELSPEEIEDIEADKRAREEDAESGRQQEAANEEKQRLLEAKARVLGWVPENEWAGRPENWAPADEWLEKGYGNNQILRSLNDKLVNDVQRLEAAGRENAVKLNEMGVVLHDIYARFETADATGYRRAKGELEQQKRDAVAEADTDKYDQAEAKLKELEKHPPPAPKPAPKPIAPVAAAPAPIDSDIVDWEKTNRFWFGKRATNPQLQAFMDATDKMLVAQYVASGASPTATQHLDAMKDEVHKRYPELFENPLRTAPGSVGRPSGDRMNGTNGRNGAKPGRSYNDLDQESKDACDRFCRTLRVFDKETGKERAYTKDDYIRTYDWNAA